MKKTVVKAVALFSTLLIGLSASGCADTTWAFKVNDITVPTGLYISNLYAAHDLLQDDAAAAASSSDSSGSSASSASSVNVWSLKKDGKDAADWAVAFATKNSKETAIIQALCKKKKITLSSDELSYLASYAANSLTDESVLKKSGVAETSVQLFLSSNMKSKALGLPSYLPSYVNKLIDAYYGKDGDSPVSDSDLLAYYQSNYTDVKQIYFSTLDDTGITVASDKLTEIESTVTSVYNELTADKSKFDALQTQYDEDTNGAQQNPAGYIFNKDNKDFIPDFVTAAFNLKVGEVTKIQSSLGWHIIYRVPLDTTSTGYTDAVKADVLQNLKMPDFEKLVAAELAKAKVTVNNPTINKYDPTKLKTS